MMSLLLFSFAGTAGYSQRTAPSAGASVRAATQEEVRQSIEDEERRIQATQPIEGLPQRLAYYIAKDFPSLSVLGRADATSEIWQGAVERGQPSPFACFGDFDGNGLQDAAVVLRENPSGKLRVLAFHQVRIWMNPGNISKLGYESYEVAPAGLNTRAPLGNFEIQCNAAGTFQSVDGSISLQLKNNSVLFGHTLYFSDGAYQSLMIEN